jgi:hypothetical protein
MFDSPVIRAIKHRFSSVDEIIQGYQTKFADLKSAFEGRAVLETEIAVGRVEDAVDRVQSAVRLLDITVTRVLDIASEAGGCESRSSFGHSDDFRCMQPLRLS